MHAIEQAFLADILQNPAEDFPRMVYADWLDDQQSEPSPRAEFIRVQCELASRRPFAPPAEIAEIAMSTRLYSMLAREQIIRAEEAYNAETARLRQREDEMIRSHLWKALRDELPAAVWQEFDRWEHKGGVIRSKRDDAWQLTFTRGFVSHVRCTLADWIGTPCDQCGGIGHLSINLVQVRGCPYCHGTGRINAHGKAIVQCQPVEQVHLPRMQPYMTFEQLWGWSRLEDARDRGSPAYLPPEVYDLLPEPDHAKPPVGLWTTEDRARAALSTALLRWAGAPGLRL